MLDTDIGCYDSLPCPTPAACLQTGLSSFQQGLEDHRTLARAYALSMTGRAVIWGRSLWLKLSYNLSQVCAARTFISLPEPPTIH